MALGTILVGVDFSETSDQTCAHALTVARGTGARIVLAHATALPQQPPNLPASMQDTADAYLGILRGRAGEAERELDAARARLSGQGVDVTQLLVDGFPDDALIHAANETKADLIVTGSHGRRGLGRLLGSVAERVVRGATCPVLVTRGAARPYRSICVATDFSAAAERGVDVALQLAPEDGAIDLIHFWDAPPMIRAHATDEVDATVAEIRDGMQTHGQDRGAAALAARGDGRLRYHLREGDPGDGLISWAAEAHTDLIVLGSHGHRGLRRLLLGSVAEATVRHAPCSVLVVH